jgi:D-sedoheptulose 7-phosphate isomerase
MTASAYTEMYLKEAAQVIGALDKGQIDAMVAILAECRTKKARLFFLGVGGSAGNCSHAVNDFRKIAGIEAYAPTDNVSELTARTNDDGFQHIFSRWLETSNVRSDDVVFVFSVGGGNAEKNISANIVEGLKVAKAAGAKVIGVVGRDGGYTKKVADACVLIPTVNAETVTPHTEASHAVVWHLIVTHPDLKKNEMKWESTR